MSSQTYPLSLRDSSDYIRYKKMAIINSEVNSNKSTNPSWISSTVEYRNMTIEGHYNCECCLTPNNPALDYETSSQEFGSYANNTYLTNILINWKRTDCAKNYRVFLVELRSSDTSYESDELKSSPANFIKKVGSLYLLQYSYESDLLGVNTLSLKKTYSPSQRIAKVYAFVFAYGKTGIPNPTLYSQPSIRYSVFDVKPLIPLNTWPSLDFTKISGIKTGSNITQISVDWEPLSDAVYYKVFLIEGNSTRYVQTQTKFSINPQKYDNTGNLFTFATDNLVNIFEFEKSYTTPISKITAFVYAFDASGVPCPFPGRCVIFDGTTNQITIDYTLNSPNNGVSYFLNEDGSSYLDKGGFPIPSLEIKSFL